MKTFFVIVLIAAAGAAGYFFAKQPAAKPVESGGRKILYYQSSMHPWIKSDRPGNCTICGMKLSPVYEGDKGFAVEGNVVQLSSNSITALNIRTMEVAERSLKRTIRAAGIVEDDDTRHRFISAYVAGRIDQLHVNFVGAEVKEGAPLATFYSPDLLAAEREYVSILPDGSRRSLIESAGLRLKRLGLSDLQITNLAAKPKELQHSEILAPMSGTVVSRFVYGGQYVMEGEKLFEIADYSKMWLQLNIYESDLPWIRTGQVVRVTAPALAARTFSGRIAFMNPTIDQMTRSAVARVELENPLVEVDGQQRRLLYHKLYADGLLEVETPKVLAAPRSAVLNAGGNPIVYIDLGGGGYEQRAVKLGRRGDDAWEILDGVSAGDHVVIEGNLLIDSQAQLNHSVNSTP